jgi:FkbM family methyltransferase
MMFESLIEYCFNKQEKQNLKLLQVGANDGLQSDPFRESIIRYKINSYVLEPIPDFFKMLSENYNDYPWVKCYNLAITKNNGVEEITYVPRVDGLPEWTQGLGTFDASKNYLGAGMGSNNLSEDYSETEIYKEVKKNIKKIKVNTNTLETFLETNNIEKLDLYVSDTEGYDWFIFEQLDLKKFKPKVIFMETHTLGEEQNEKIDKKLIDNGYTILDKTWDTIAIKK